MAEHICKEHGTNFFKRGKMSGYAHPIEDKEGKTTGWCNEEDAETYHSPQGDEPPPQEHEPVSDKMTKGDWAEKERITRQSIQRQTAIKASTELAVAKVRAGKETSLNEILAVAITFESYLESGANVEKKK